MSKKLIILALSAGVLLAGCGEGRSQESALAEAKLKATCDELTKVDKEGRIYEEIIGRYVEEKSHGAIEQPDPGFPIYSYVLALKTNDKEYSLHHSKVITTKETYGEYISKIKKVIDDHKENSDFTHYEYGVCAMKDREDEYMFLIDTLTLIKGE